MSYSRWHVAQKLKQLRLRRSMTLLDLAGESGLPVKSIERFEAASADMGFDEACALADALGCTLEELACRAEMPSNEQAFAPF